MAQEPTWGEQEINGKTYTTLTYEDSETLYWFPTFGMQGMWANYNGLMNLLKEYGRFGEA